MVLHKILSRPKSVMMGSMSELKRMLEGLMFPWTCFLSWMKAMPLAIPLAIFNLASNAKLNGDDPVLPAYHFLHFINNYSI